jgi:hypothetical protein
LHKIRHNFRPTSLAARDSSYRQSRNTSGSAHTRVLLLTLVHREWLNRECAFCILNLLRNLVALTRAPIVKVSDGDGRKSTSGGAFEVDQPARCRIELAEKKKLRVPPGSAYSIVVPGKTNRDLQTEIVGPALAEVIASSRRATLLADRSSLRHLLLVFGVVELFLPRRDLLVQPGKSPSTDLVEAYGARAGPELALVHRADFLERAHTLEGAAGLELVLAHVRVLVRVPA